MEKQWRTTNLWSSKDISLAIFLGALAFVYSAFTIQVGFLVTGIPGIGYFFTSGIAIIFSIAFLMFKGRRWRFFVVTLIYQFLISFILVNLGPFHIFRAIPMLTATFIQDIIFNSVYDFFEKRKKLIWYSISSSIVGTLLDTFLRILTYPILMPAEFTLAYLNVTYMMIPVILFNAIFGGYIAFKIYERIGKPEKQQI
jgi:hypothetical protein